MSEPLELDPTNDPGPGELEQLDASLETVSMTLSSILSRLNDLESESPDAPVPDESLADRIHAAETQRDLVRARWNLLQIQRDVLAMETTIQSTRDAWDETVDGPIPPSPEPLPLTDENDPRTESERLLAAYAQATSDLRQTLDAYRATNRLMDTSKTGMRRRAARARASGAIDPVALYAELESHFGPTIAFPPNTIMDVHVRDERGRTPLMRIVENGAENEHPERLGRVNVLLAMGSDIDTKDNEGNTALAYAVTETPGNADLVTLLIAHGADPFSKNNEGKTVLELARSFAVRAILFGSTGELRHRIANTLTGEQAKNMAMFRDEPEGAAELFRDVLAKFG